MTTICFVFIINFCMSSTRAYHVVQVAELRDMVESTSQNNFFDKYKSTLNVDGDENKTVGSSKLILHVCKICHIYFFVIYIYI